MQPFSLNTAQQPGPTPAPDFEIVLYSNLARGAQTLPLAGATAVYLDNHGGDVLLVEIETGAPAAVLRYLLDAHEAKMLVAPAPATAITITDLLVDAAPFLGPLGGAAGTLYQAPNESPTALNGATQQETATQFVAVTVCDLPFALASTYRQRSYTALAAANGTVWGVTNPFPVEIVAPGVVAVDPRQTLYDYAAKVNDTQRTPDVFKSINTMLDVKGELVAWTTGFRFRLLGGWLASTTAMAVSLADNAAANSFATVYCPASGLAAPVELVANGYIAQAAGHRLLLEGTANAPIYGTLFGTEEA